MNSQRRIEMRDPERISILLRELEHIWKKYPDWRLCQLLSGIAFKGGFQNPDLFHLEDDILLRYIRRYDWDPCGHSLNDD